MKALTIFFVEQLDYLTAVTKMLNAQVPNLPEGDGFYIHVELRDSSTNKPVGEWSDEIASDCWSFETVDEVKA